MADCSREPPPISKRRAEDDLISFKPKAAHHQVESPEAPRPEQRKHPWQVYRPRAFHPGHPLNGMGKHFHNLPYPLTLLPESSWQRLHKMEQDDAKFVCRTCNFDQGEPPAHKHKLFLVAERLSWGFGLTSGLDREQNEMLLWQVNYKLGILDPVVESSDHRPGGTYSKDNEYHPFDTELEMEVAMKLIKHADTLSQNSWKMWLATLDSFATNDDALDKEDMDNVQARAVLVEVSSNVASGPSSGSSTKKSRPDSCYKDTGSTTSPEALKKPGAKQGIKYRVLPDFYALLDKIERTSYVGARFLEAYADHLRNDRCTTCWFTRYVDADMPDDAHTSLLDIPKPPQNAVAQIEKNMTSTPCPSQHLKTPYPPAPQVKTRDWPANVPYINTLHSFDRLQSQSARSGPTCHITKASRLAGSHSQPTEYRPDQVASNHPSHFTPLSQPPSKSSKYSVQEVSPHAAVSSLGSHTPLNHLCHNDPNAARSDTAGFPQRTSPSTPTMLRPGYGGISETALLRMAEEYKSGARLDQLLAGNNVQPYARDTIIMSIIAKAETLAKVQNAGKSRRDNSAASQSKTNGIPAPFAPQCPESLNSDSPRLQPEPTLKQLTESQASIWSKDCFEEDSSSEVTQVELWRAYNEHAKQSILQVQACEKLTGTELIRVITKVFPNARAQRTILNGEYRYICRGIRARSGSSLARPVSIDSKPYINNSRQSGSTPPLKSLTNVEDKAMECKKAPLKSAVPALAKNGLDETLKEEEESLQQADKGVTGNMPALNSRVGTAGSLANEMFQRCLEADRYRRTGHTVSKSPVISTSERASVRLPPLSTPSPRAEVPADIAPCTPQPPKEKICFATRGIQFTPMSASSLLRPTPQGNKAVQVPPGSVPRNVISSAVRPETKTVRRVSSNLPRSSTAPIRASEPPGLLIAVPPDRNRPSFPCSSVSQTIGGSQPVGSKPASSTLKASTQEGARAGTVRENGFRTLPTLPKW